ncbi:hypothetical protein [Streptomyces sp. NPDC057253]|uniref:hypothetical protein n=1 Tax=Streptomyces sp. NPDC057253 TaxID=3346069 RepID=UPI00363898A8
MTAHLGPVPGFPRWTGVKAVMTGPTSVRDGALVTTVEVKVTKRARAWARWRARRKGVLGAAP